MPTLTQARRQKSLTQQQLADKLGVTRTLISGWERGINKPAPPRLATLCQILETTPEELELTPKLDEPLATDAQRKQQIQAHDESMGYVDSTWLRGGRYDVDPAFHEGSST